MGERRLPDDHDPDGGHRGGGDDHRHRARVPARVLRGADGHAADAERAAGRGRAAAVGELPGPGLRVEAHAHPERVRELARRAHGARLAPARRSNWAVWLTFGYLWLPFTLLPIYAALERVPGSLLEASSRPGRAGLDDLPERDRSR